MIILMHVIEGSRVAGRAALLTAFGCAVLSLIPKAFLLLSGALPFHADEAVVALMARHILAGERPAFFYGQAYMGSLDAFLAAAAFAVLGQNVVILRLVQAGLYALAVFLGVLLAQRIHHDLRTSIFAGLLLAIPTVNNTLYTSVTLGGYGEALVLGILLLLLALQIAGGKQGVLAYAAWGFAAAMGFWAFALSLVFALPSLVAVGIGLNRTESGRGRRVVYLLAGTVVGLTPWMIGLQQVGLLQALREITGSAIAGASGANWLVSLAAHARNLILLGGTVIVGLRPPWEVRWLALPLAPLALAFWLGAGLLAGAALFRRDRTTLGRWLLMGVIVTTLLGFLLTPFGSDPSGRYFLPLVVPMAILGAEALRRLHEKSPILAWSSLGVLLAFHVWGLAESIQRNPPGVTTQFDAVTWIDRRYDAQLRSFLQEQGETRGYTNYWVAYPLAFLSQETLIYVPALPYHPDLRYTARDDRYPPYAAEVAASRRVAYITTNNPRLDARLRAGMLTAGIDWHETWIGDYHVYYRLSRPISPQELDVYAEQLTGTSRDAPGGAMAPMTAVERVQASP
jgi:hypothetical protein